MGNDHEEREARAYRVYGRVQGVGFRWWAREVAEDLGLGGSVRNMADGSVEVRAAGERRHLDRFEESLRRGPKMARVDRLEPVVADPAEALGVFRIEP